LPLFSSEVFVLSPSEEKSTCSEKVNAANKI
jgi:hypothetical protein